MMFNEEYYEHFIPLNTPRFTFVFLFVPKELTYLDQIGHNISFSTVTIFFVFVKSWIRKMNVSLSLLLLLTGKLAANHREMDFALG